MPRILTTTLAFLFCLQFTYSQKTETNIFEDIPLWPYLENGKYGIKVIDTLVLIKPQYEEFGELGSNAFIPAKKNGKWGFINAQNKTVIPFKYDYVSAFRGPVSIASVGKKKILIDKQGKELTPEYDNIRDLRFFSEERGYNLFPVKHKDKWGFLDPQGKVVVPIQYASAAPFSEEKAKVRKPNGKIGYIDPANKVVIPFEYDKGFDFEDGSAAVIKDGYYWLINSEGKTITSRFTDMSDEEEEFITVKISENGREKCGKINRHGKLVVPVIYEEIGETVDGIAPAKKEGNWGYINMDNQPITPFKYTDAKTFIDSRARVKRGGKWGAINKTGKEIVPVEYDHLYDLQQGLFAAKLNGKTGFIGYDNQKVIPFIYDGIYTMLGLDATGFEDGLVCVKKDGKFGFINKQGEAVIPIKYDYAEGFMDGMAVVGQNGKLGYIEANGKEVIALKYKMALYFTGGIAGVEDDKDKYFIDRTGKKVATPEKNPYDIFGQLAEAMEEID